MEKDLVSVVMPVYNVSSYLKESVRSVLQQDYTNLEVILVNDGSTDDSGALCDELALADKRIKVTHQPNRGPGGARNAGIELAKGEYIAFLDSDDLMAENYISILLTLLLKNNADIACSGYTLFCEDNILKKKYEFSEPVCLDGISALRRMFSCDGVDSQVAGKLYKAFLWKELRFPEKHLFEDVPLTYRQFLMSGNIVISGKALYKYRMRSGSTTHSALTAKYKDYTDYTSEVKAYIYENYPQLKDDADIFYLNAVLSNYFRISCGNSKNEFKDYYMFLKNEIAHNRVFIIKSKKITFNNKVSMILSDIGLYEKILHLKEIYDARKR